MADSETPVKQDEALPPPEPAGPGLLMVGGVALLIVAVWCGKDFFFPSDEWVKKDATWKIWGNGGGMLIAVLGSLYCFVQAVIRSRKSKPAADKKPDEPGLL